MNLPVHCSVGGMMEVVAWSVLSCLQNCLNQSDIKFMPASDIIFVSQNSANKTSVTMIRQSPDSSSAHFTTGNLL